MIILKANEKEVRLKPTTRKVVELTEQLKAKNLNELLFSSYSNNNLKILSEVIKAFGVKEDETAMFTSIGTVYDFIDEWKLANEKTSKDLFKEVIKIVNEMGFFTEKMSEEELAKELDNPISSINLEELMKNSAQKMVDKIAEEEFKGYKG